MGQPQIRKLQVCDRCGGRFGMVTHRWWGHKFCKRTGKEAHVRATSRSLYRATPTAQAERASAYPPQQVSSSKLEPADIM
jgi:hypothetical protein